LISPLRPWKISRASVRLSLSHPAGNGFTARVTQYPTAALAEQKRIVAKVDLLMALCDGLEAKQTKKRDLATQSTRSALTASPPPRPLRILLQHGGVSPRISRMC